MTLLGRALSQGGCGCLVNDWDGSWAVAYFTLTRHFENGGLWSIKHKDSQYGVCLRLWGYYKDLEVHQPRPSRSHLHILHKDMPATYFTSAFHHALGRRGEPSRRKEKRRCYQSIRNRRVVIDIRPLFCVWSHKLCNEISFCPWWYDNEWQ